MMVASKLLTLLSIVCLIPIVLANHKNDGYDFSGFANVASMPYAASDMVATTFEEDIFKDNNGPRIYLTGGCVSEQTCSKDDYCSCTKITSGTMYFMPEDSKFEIVANMSVPRYRHMAAKVDNKLYVAGGRGLDNDNLIKMIEVYDPETNSWSDFVTWENATSDGVAFGVDGLLFIVNGYNADYSDIPAEMTVLNVTSKKFVQKHKLGNDFASLRTRRGDTQIAEVKGEFYVLGGWNITSDFCTPTNLIEKYSYEKNTWELLPGMDLGRGDLAAGVMKNWIFSVGGERKNDECSLSVPVKTVERYIPDQAEWEEEESIPDDLFRFVAASYNSSLDVRSSAIYIFGGQGMLVNDNGNYYHPIKSSTIKYVPKSASNSHKDELSEGGIAGIVIAGIVVIAVIVAAIVAYFIYRNTVKYQSLNDDVLDTEMASQVTNQQKAATAPTKSEELEEIQLRESGFYNSAFSQHGNHGEARV